MAGKIVAAVLVLLMWSGGVSVASAAPPPTAQCAWQFMSNSTVLNVAFPDASATYWVLPYALASGDTIELSGTYPAARYFSLNTYGTNFDTVDTLRDNQIGPDPGSGNPFTDASAGSLPATQKRWHAIRRSSVWSTRCPATAIACGRSMTAVPIEASCRAWPNGWPIPRDRCACRA